MKVLSGPIEWTRRIKCGCGSELEIEASDVKPGAFGPNYGGDHPELRFYVECPSCGGYLFVAAHELPRTVYAAGLEWWGSRHS